MKIEGGPKFIKGDVRVTDRDIGDLIERIAGLKRDSANISMEHSEKHILYRECRVSVPLDEDLLERMADDGKIIGYTLRFKSRTSFDPNRKMVEFSLMNDDEGIRFFYEDGPVFGVFQQQLSINTYHAIWGVVESLYKKPAEVGAQG